MYDKNIRRKLMEFGIDENKLAIKKKFILSHFEIEFYINFSFKFKNR